MKFLEIKLNFFSLSPSTGHICLLHLQCPLACSHLLLAGDRRGCQHPDSQAVCQWDNRSKWENLHWSHWLNVCHWLCSIVGNSVFRHAVAQVTTEISYFLLTVLSYHYKRSQALIITTSFPESTPKICILFNFVPQESKHWSTSWPTLELSPQSWKGTWRSLMRT